jgi:hypothetical protein
MELWGRDKEYLETIIADLKEMDLTKIDIAASIAQG